MFSSRSIVDRCLSTVRPSSYCFTCWKLPCQGFTPSWWILSNNKCGSKILGHSSSRVSKAIFGSATQLNFFLSPLQILFSFPQCWPRSLPNKHPAHEPSSESVSWRTYPVALSLSKYSINAWGYKFKSQRFTDKQD